MKRIGLLPRLFAAIALGIVVGFFAPEWAIRAMNSFGSTFGQFIKFIVPFIIVGLVTAAIIEAGSAAGRMLVMTMAIAWVSTVVFGYFAFFVSSSVFPRIMDGALVNASAAKTFAPFFTLQIPPVLDFMTALVTSFVIGFGAIATRSEVIRKASIELKEIVSITLAKAFVPFLPLYVFTIMADLTASGKLAAVGGSSVKIMVLAIATSVVVLLLQFTIAGIVAGRNPLRCLWNMLPAYLTGWGCCSSAATIPYTLACAKKNGVSDDTAALVIPLCSSVHMAGSMSNMVIYAMGLIMLCGEPVSIAAFTEYILMISVIAIASPGVPGGIVLASAGVAEAALGFSPERYALMIALYLALDGMGTACNLTGDGAIALIVDRLRGRKDG